MASRTEHKTEQPPKVEPSRQDLQAVYQAHTLAQYVYGQLGANHPWMFQGPTTQIDPLRSYHGAPWSPVWTQFTGYPTWRGW